MFEVERVRNSWQRESDAIDGLIAALSAEAAAQPIRDDGWTAHDVLGHIANSARGFLAYMRGERTESFDVHALNEQQRLRGQQRSWAEVQAYWQRARDEVAAFLAGATSEIGVQAVNMPWLPQIKTADDALKILIRHTRSHREELERGIQSMQTP